MTDHWGGWPSDQPDFDDPDDHTVDGFDQHDDGFHAADGFDADGPADGFEPAEPVDGFGAANPPAGADPYAETGFGSVDAYAEAGFGPAEQPDGDPSSIEPVGGDPLVGPPVGADPDLGPYGDPAAWPVVDETLVGWPADIPPPEPVDGFPWTDPELLGRPEDVPAPEPTAESGPAPDELAAYAAEGLPVDGDPWSALAASEDPATSSLARFWQQPEDR
ncbi:hypothetical protein [Plantactinospora sp. B5E13]|uniref:hypothetical protein n=1 Tax=Plantactinospora sp. B5E13 TaxID=3153758 RepID=UPI00325E52F3